MNFYLLQAYIKKLKDEIRKAKNGTKGKKP